MIRLNGKDFAGRSITVINGRVIIDGNKLSGEDTTKSIKIEIHGDLASIRVDRGDVEVHGNVAGNVDAGGSIQCKDVEGNVDAGGSIQCGDVKGDVDAGGSINCGNVGGSVDAGGSVMHQ